MRNDLPELLAPAGGFPALEAAIEAGADAVYFGGENFGARAFAKNFSRDEIAAAAKLCRAFGVKSYVTLNTLVFDREMRDMLAYAAFLEEAGVDALIIADPGEDPDHAAARQHPVFGAQCRRGAVSRGTRLYTHGRRARAVARRSHRALQSVADRDRDLHPWRALRLPQRAMPVQQHGGRAQRQPRHVRAALPAARQKRELSAQSERPVDGKPHSRAACRRGEIAQDRGAHEGAGIRLRRDEDLPPPARRAAARDAGGGAGTCGDLLAQRLHHRLFRRQNFVVHARRAPRGR